MPNPRAALKLVGVQCNSAVENDWDATAFDPSPCGYATKFAATGAARAEARFRDPRNTENPAVLREFAALQRSCRASEFGERISGIGEFAGRPVK
jgi:hypothetical protein